MTGQDGLLVEILATQDAVWAPLRAADWGSPHGPANLHQARRLYASEGVPWSSGRVDEAGRKESQRDMEAMASAGLIRLFGRGNRRSIGVALTERGELRARNLAGLPGAVETHAAMEALVAFTAPYRESVWINETILLFGRQGDYDRLKTLGVPGRVLCAQERTFVPALARGWAMARSDCEGRVFYAVTEAGVERNLQGPPEAPALPGTDPDATRIYSDAYETRRRELGTRTPAIPYEIGEMPLPVSGPTIRALDGASDPPARKAKK